LPTFSRDRRPWLLSFLPAGKEKASITSGKWKLLILISINSGNHRFREIERSIPKITSKVLAKELKDLEEYLLIKRTVYDKIPVSIEYTVTPYAQSLGGVIQALRDWCVNHRKMLMIKSH
jgi:DNA-binding HxlR family transcriptional regulator